jgi:hypothetical protein
VFIHGSGINSFPPAKVIDMVYGRAYRPYVYRTLIPSLVRFLSVLTPRSVGAVVNRVARPSVLAHVGWEPDHAIEYLILLILMGLSLFGFIVATRYLFNSVFEAPTFVSEVTSLIAVACLPGFLAPYGRHIYDFSTLFLFTLGLGLLARAKWKWFLIVYLVACINKETTILLTLVFLVHYRRASGSLSREAFLRVLTYQLVIFFVIKTFVTVHFRTNPGSGLEFHLLDHNYQLLLHPYAFSTVITWLGLAVFTFYDWRHKPRFLLHGLVILPPLLIVVLFGGLLDELRAYYEVYPVVLLLLAHSAWNAIGFDVTSRTRQPAWQPAGSSTI